MLTPGIFPSIPVAIDERVSAACFSKVDDRYLVVFSKTDLIVYDTTYGAAAAAAGGVGAEQDGATPAAAGTQKSAGSAAVGFPRKRHSHGMNSDGDPGAASSSDDEDDADSPTTVQRGGARVSGAGKIRVQHTRSCVSFAADADDADPEASHDTLGRISAAPSPTTRTTSRNKGDEDPGAATGEPALVHEMSNASADSASSGNLSTKAARKHARRLQHQAIADAKSAGDSEITIRPSPRVWPTMSITLEERKKIIYNSRTHLQHKLALKAAYCFALTFSADDSLLAVGLMQGFSQLCTVYIYDTSTWTLVKKLPRCNAVEFFPKAEIVPGIDTSKWICVQDLAELRNEVLDTGDNFSSVASWYSTTLDVSRLKRKAAPVVISPDAQFVVTTRTAYALARQERVISLDADDDSGVQMRFLFMDFSRKESAGKKLSAATGPFLFAAVMQVQGENKIYIYAVDDWTDRKDENGDLLHPPAGKSRKHPIMRLYEPNVTYHGVRFVNSDRSLTSYGDDTGGLGSSGIRFWCTETWALTHIVPDGTAELFPYCCGWTNGWLFVLPNRRKQAEEREQLGSRFGDARARAYKGYTARCYDYSGGASKVTQKVVHLGWSNGHRNGVMAFTQQLYISGNVFVKAKDPRLANRFLILGHDHTISVHDLMADPPKVADTSSSAAYQLAEDAGDSPEHDGPQPLVHQQFSLVTLPNDPDADWAEMEQESDKSFYVLDAVLVLSSPSSDAEVSAGQQDQDAQHGSAGAPRGRLLLSAVMGIEGGRASRVGNEIGIFEIPLSEKIFADALTQLNTEQLGAATAAEENEGGGGDAGARPESESPAAAPEYHKVISCSEDDLATITDPRSIPKLKSVTSFKACEKFFAEKQSVKGRFSSDGRLFFANCVQPDEAHMYLVPAAGTNTGGSSALDSSPTPSDAREDGSSTTQASNKLPSPLQMIGDDNEIVEIGRYHRENWECQIIFDRTYTSGQPLFSPDSRWFAYNGELYATEDWTCVSDEWSEADIRCDRDTITGRYLSNDIFIADSSEGNEKGLLQIYRLQRAGGGGGNVNAFRSAATVLAGRATGAARAAGVDPGAAIPSTAGLPLSSPVVKSTSFVDVMATALDRSSTAASPERGGRDEERDVRADVADAAAPSGVMSSGTGYLGLRAAIMRHQQKQWIFDRKIGNRKALRHLFAHFDEIVTVEGNWLAVSDPGTMTAIYDMDAGLELCFATACKKSRGLLGCMRVASENGMMHEPNKQIRLTNLREKKRSLLMRWTRSFPGFLNQVDAVSRKSLLYLAIEAGEKQTATCIFEAVAALNVKLSLHARYNLKLLKLGPSKFADLSLLADEQDEDGGQEAKSMLPTGRASVSSFAVEDFYYTDEDVGQGAFGAIFKGRRSQSSMFFPSRAFFPNKASGGGRNSTASVFTNGDEVAETRSASQASGGIGPASRRSFGYGGGSGTGFFEQEDVDLTPRTTSKLAGKMIGGKTKALKRSLHSLGARSAGLARALNNGIGKTSIARLKKQLGLEEREILRIREENELSLAIRLHERDLTHMFIERILEEGFTQTSLPLVWNCLPALLKWVPAEAEKVLEAFVIEPPFVVPELKAFVDPASRLISKGTDFYGYQMNVWADYLEQQGSLRQHDLDAALEPMTAKVLAIPEMVSGSGDGQGLLTLLMECNVPSSFYASTPARILINYKWEAYARDELQMYFVTYVLFLLSYTVFAIQLRERLDPYDFEPTKEVEHQLVAGLTLVFYLGCMTYRYTLLRRHAPFYLPLLFYVSVAFILTMNNRGDLLHTAVLTILYSYTLRSFVDEVQELRQKTLAHYVQSIWNLFDVTLCVLNVLTFIAYATATRDGSRLLDGYLIRAVTTSVLMAWLKIFYFCQPFRNLGSFIRMLIEIFYDIRYFLIVVLISLFGFGTAFFVLYKDDWVRQIQLLEGSNISGNLMKGTVLPANERKLLLERDWPQDLPTAIPAIPGGAAQGQAAAAPQQAPRDVVLATQHEVERLTSTPYPNLWLSVLNMYVVMLGTFETDNFTMTEHPFFATLLFVLFTFEVMIILLNLLIAIMSDTFERVRENEQNTFLRTRADMICDLQKLTFRRIRYDKWVHALLPIETEQGRQGAWKGKLGEIKDLIKHLKVDFAKELEAHLRDLEDKLTGAV
eukprot:g5628.t1